MKKKMFSLLMLVSVCAIGLVACGGSNNGDKEDNQEAKQEDIAKFPVKTENEQEVIKDGEMEVAVVADSQFKGIFLQEYREDTYDHEYMRPSHEALFYMDKDFKVVDGGPANLKIDQENSTATITLRDDLKWNDGEPVTADDVIYSYEIIGHKDYDSVRYEDSMRAIKGMDEYHDGKTEQISGIEKVNDREVKISYKEVNPSMLQYGGGIWPYAAPKHALKDIPVKELASSDVVRKKPITFGPYYMNNIVSGESVEYLPNEHYYGEKPKLKKLILKTVPSASIVEGLKAKKYDMAFKIPTDIYDTYKSLDGYTNLGRPELSYTYIGFKLGTWDKDKKENIYNPKAKMADKNLRQAMGYALNNDAVGEKFYNGLRSNATTLIPEVFGTYHDSDIKGYTEDLEKAKKLLDDAGYKDTDGDDYREDKDGKPLVIKFASMSGGETAQPLADYYVQQWKSIGLKVEYTTGRLIEFNSFYDKLKEDDPEVDIYMGAWGTGEDPEPSGLYGDKAAFNYTRFVSEENTELIHNIGSAKSFDKDYQKEAFSKWQKYAFEEAFVIPTLYRNEVLPVNDRVTGWTWEYDYKAYPWSAVGVTAENR